jgi:hypothetical protein
MMDGDEARPPSGTDTGADAEIESFLRSFEDCSFPRSAWTHEKHLIMALWYLRQCPRDEATRRIRDGIRRYNESHGNLTGYHETITLAWIGVIAGFLARRDRSLPISALARSLLESCGHKDHLLRFYSKDVLLSEEARRRWVPPDREPLE